MSRLYHNSHLVASAFIIQFSFLFTYFISKGGIDMFGTETVSRGLSLVKVLGGINKTLSIANQVIPIYQQAKPMIQNAKNAFKVLKEFSAPVTTNQSIATNSKSESPKSSTIDQKKTNSPSSYSSKNQPVFFI